MLPRVRAGPDPGDGYGQARLCELVLDLLSRLSADGAPVLLVLEDLHWADRSSREVLAFLGRNLRAERIAIALTYRTGELESDDPLRRLLAELARRPNVTRVDLTPLDRAGVALLVEAIAGEPVPAALADELSDRSGGNPFFVEELFAVHREGGGELPATLSEAVLARVGALEPSAQRLLIAVSAAGGRTGAAVLEAMVPDGGLSSPLHEALDAGLLVRDGDDVVLRHGLIGEVVYGRLMPAERSELHAELARALAASGAPPAQLADQWHRAGRRADALAASVEAGLAAAADHAFAEASSHLDRALELWDPADAPSLPVDHTELLVQAARAARFGGDRERSVDLVRQAIAELDPRADPGRAALLHARLGEYLYWDDEAALDCYGRALELLPAGSGTERARLLTAEGHALMGLRRWPEARARCESALAIARELGDAREEAAARITLGLVLAFLGEHEAGEAHLRQALLLPAGERLPRAYVHLGELLRLDGRHADAFAAMEEGERVAARLGMRGSFGHFMYVNAADDLIRLGRWDEAADRLRRAERLELALTAAVLHHGLTGRLHALRGDTEAARHRLERALELLAEGLPAEFGTPVRSALAALELAEGDPQAAGRHVDAALAALGEDGDPLYAPELMALGVRAAADAAERARALREDGGPATARRTDAARRARARRGRAARRDGAPADRPRRAGARGRRARTGALAGRGDGMGRARRALSGRLGAVPARRGPARRGRRPPGGLGIARAGACGRDRAGGSPAARGGRGARPPRAAPAARGRPRRTGGAGHRRARADRPRGRGPRAARGRPDQPGDRRAAVHHPQDRGHPRRPRLRQARRAQPRRGRRPRTPPGRREPPALTHPRVYPAPTLGAATSHPCPVLACAAVADRRGLRRRHRTPG